MHVRPTVTQSLANSLSPVRTSPRCTSVLPVLLVVLLLLSGPLEDLRRARFSVFYHPISDRSPPICVAMASDLCWTLLTPERHRGLIFIHTFHRFSMLDGCIQSPYACPLILFLKDQSHQDGVKVRCHVAPLPRFSVTCGPT